MTIMEDRPDIADPDVVANHAKTLTDAQLLCRKRNRHDFDPEAQGIPLTAKYIPQDGEWERRVECLCGAKLTERLDAKTFQITSRRIDYTDIPDYLLKGVGRVDADGRNEIRREFYVGRGRFSLSTQRNADRNYRKRVERGDG
jgi:hypothetical protein